LAAEERNGVRKAARVQANNAVCLTSFEGSHGFIANKRTFNTFLW